MKLYDMGFLLFIISAGVLLSGAYLKETRDEIDEIKQQIEELHQPAQPIGTARG